MQNQLLGRYLLREKNWGGADKNSQLANTLLFAARRFEQGFRRGSMFGIAPLIRHH
jgi:hypothetical protein